MSRRTVALLERALAESVKLQGHYAKLLNMHDGGARHVFASSGEWLARLDEVPLARAHAREQAIGALGSAAFNRAVALDTRISVAIAELRVGSRIDRMLAARLGIDLAPIIATLEVHLETLRAELRRMTDDPCPSQPCMTPQDSQVECPGEHCPMCNGSSCNKCGAGCWNNAPKERCDHDVTDRHEAPC